MKHIHRFFVSQPLASGVSACLDKEDGFHAGKVLRLAAGDAVELAGPDGRVFAARVARVDGGVEAVAGDEIGREEFPRESRLTVVQSMPSGKKMDLVIEKLSELGVFSLVPVFSDRSVARPSQRGAGKLERWRRIARSAASQSKRNLVMGVDEPVDLGTWLRGFGGELLVLSTEAEGVPLGDAVGGLNGSPALAIGPEAGFSQSELENFQRSGAVFASLGPQVLRTETAALVAATVVMHRLGRLG